MFRIVPSIDTLEQHLFLLKHHPDIYRPSCCPFCGMDKLWSHGHYLRKADRAGMLADRPEVERAILIIGKGQGYRVQQSRDAHAGNQGTDQLDEGRCTIASACEL